MVAESVTVLRPSPRPFTSAEDDYIIANYNRMLLSEIAGQLGRPVESVRRRARHLGEEGRLDPSTRYYHRRWTRKEELEALELLERGASLQTIARRLDRSPTAVKVWLTRHTGIRNRRPLSASDVARLLGLGCPKSVAWWCRRGWLRCSRELQNSRGRQYLVRYDDLVRFLEDSRYWYLWEPARIRDSALREWATDIRTERYLTTGQVASRLHVSVGAVGEWIRKGLLPAVRRANWLVRERDLQAFVVPADRPRSGGTMRRFSREEDRMLIALRGEGRSWSEIAARMGRHPGSVQGRYVRLIEREQALDHSCEVKR